MEKQGELATSCMGAVRIGVFFFFFPLPTWCGSSFFFHELPLSCLHPLLVVNGFGGWSWPSGDTTSLVIDCNLCAFMNERMCGLLYVGKGL